MTVHIAGFDVFVLIIHFATFIGKQRILKYYFLVALQNGRRLATPKGGGTLTVYEAVALMIAFAVLVVKLIEYLEKRK